MRGAEPVDIVMLGTFAAWRLGTLQSRALPLAIELRRQGVRCAIVTTPWDLPTERGLRDIISGVPLINTSATSPTAAWSAVAEQVRLVRALRPRAVHVFKPKGFGGLAARSLARELPVI